MPLTLYSQIPDPTAVKSKSVHRQGLAVPVRGTPKGRLALLTGDALAKSVIASALGDGENSNPFRQDRTLGAKMLFAPNDPRVQSAIQSRLIAAFDEFERQRRYRLMQDTITWESQGSELSLTFMYHDLEADKSQDFVYSFSTVGGA